MERRRGHLAAGRLPMTAWPAGRRYRAGWRAAAGRSATRESFACSAAKAGGDSRGRRRCVGSRDGQPLADSTPTGKVMWEGNGRARARTTPSRCAARSGAVAGVATTVMRRPRAASRAARSRSGIVWPCAGYGITRTCGADAAAAVAIGMGVVAAIGIVWRRYGGEAGVFFFSFFARLEADYEYGGIFVRQY